jgi:hypothetical protein
MTSSRGLAPGLAGPGTVLVKPRGVPHAFWNPTDQPEAARNHLTSRGRVRRALEALSVLAADADRE